MRHRRVAAAIVAAMAGTPVNVYAKPPKPAHHAQTHQDAPTRARAGTGKVPQPEARRPPQALPGPLQGLSKAHAARKACQPYAEHIRAAAKAYGLDGHTLEALLWHESRLDPKVGRSAKGAVGIAQFTASGRRGLERMRQARGAPLKFTLADALNPFLAIPAAAEFLAGLRDYCGSLPRALGAYATGQCRRGAAYARRILRYAEWLRQASEPRT